MSTTTLQFSLKVNGVFTDLDSDAVLEDPAATFGVRRTDTLAIVVAAGTAMVHIGTGLYSYSFTDPAPGLTYEYWPKGTFNSQPISDQRFSVSPAPATAGTQYTLVSARQTWRAWMRSNGYDSLSYTDATGDQAMSLCMDELVRKTTLLRRLDTLTLTSGDNAIPGIPTNFRPDRLTNAYLVGTNVVVSPSFPAGYSPYFTVAAPAYPAGSQQTATLNLKPYEQVLNETYAFRDPNGGNSVTGQPCDLGFDTRAGTGIVFPTPDQNYTMTLMWNDLATVWIPGTQGAWSVSQQYYLGDVVSESGILYQAATTIITDAPTSNAMAWISLGAGTLPEPEDVVFNLVDDYLRPVLIFGVPSLMQYTEPSNGYALSAKARWEAFIASMAGKGDLGENYFVRASAARDGGYGVGLYDGY